MLNECGHDQEDDTELEDDGHGEVLPEDQDDDQVKRDAEEVHGRRSSVLGDVLAAEVAHRWPKDPNADFEKDERGEDYNHVFGEEDRGGKTDGGQCQNESKGVDLKKITKRVPQKALRSEGPCQHAEEA